MVIVDAHGVIMLVNAQAERLFGYSRGEMLGRPVEILVPEPYRVIHRQHRGGYFHAARVRPMGAGLELFGRRQDGSEFPVEISLSPVETADGPLAISAIRDIASALRRSSAACSSRRRTPW